MDAQRFRTGFNPELIYMKLYNPRWPYTREDHTLKMSGDVERLRMEILLSQPAPPPQCNTSPRRLLTVGTGLNEPGAPHAEIQSTEREGIFPHRASVNGLLHVCTQVRNRDRYIASSRRRGRRRRNGYFRTSRCSRAVCETIQEAAAANNDSTG